MLQHVAAIFKDFHDNWKKIYEELEKLRERIINSSKEPTYGLHRKKQMPFFRMFDREIFGETKERKKDFVAAEGPAYYGMNHETQISHLVNLTQQVYLVVERELRLIGFWESIPARNKLKSELQKILLSAEFSKLPGIIANWKHILSRIIEIAESKNDTILYAE